LSRYGAPLRKRKRRNAYIISVDSTLATNLADLYADPALRLLGSGIVAVVIVEKKNHFIRSSDALSLCPEQVYPAGERG
jgi:hypothetical protein